MATSGQHNVRWAGVDLPDFVQPVGALATGGREFDLGAISVRVGQAHQLVAELFAPAFDCDLKHPDGWCRVHFDFTGRWVDHFKLFAEPVQHQCAQVFGL